MTTQEFSGLALERRGHTAIVTLTNPPAHTWTEASLGALTRLVRELDADR
jgi:enoyl-CoA hydratase/carnithine racemase